MTKKFYSAAELPLYSNEDLAELVRQKAIDPGQEMAAKFRRATADTRDDAATAEYRKMVVVERNRLKSETDAMRAETAKMNDEIKLLKVQILERGGTL